MKPILLPGLALLCTAFAFVSTGCGRKGNTAKTTIQIQIGAVHSSMPSPPGAFGVDQTRIAGIESAATLGPVIDALNLEEQWGKSRTDAVNHLRRGLSVEPLKGTDLMEIRVRDKDSQLAADIANAIAESYLDRLIETEKARKETVLAKLEESLAAQEKRVADLRSDNSPSDEIDVQSEILNEIKAQLAKARADIASARSAVMIHERAMP